MGDARPFAIALGIATFCSPESAAREFTCARVERVLEGVFA